MDNAKVRERLNGLRSTLWAVEGLKKRSRWLRSLNEAVCNANLTPRQEKREARIEAECEDLAKRIPGMKVYFQGDPRGCALYLIPKAWTDEEAGSMYSSGVALY